MDRLGSLAARPSRVRVRRRRRRDRRSGRAARRGRRLRVRELGRARLIPAHMMRRFIVAIAALLVATTARAQDIDRTLPAQLSAATRATLERYIDSARVAGLPIDPLYSKVREGVFRSADEARVIAAVRRLGRDLGDARLALGDSAGAEELTAGANALRAGVRPADLSRLRESR